MDDASRDFSIEDELSDEDDLSGEEVSDTRKWGTPSKDRETA